MDKKYPQISHEKHTIKIAFILILIFAASFAVRFIRLDFYSLWYDEITTANLVEGKSVSQAFHAILKSTGSETLHPLYYLVLSVWTQIGGNSDSSLRFPSVIFGSCAVVVYAFLLYQLTGRRTPSVGLPLIIAPFMVWYSRDARPYALIMFLTGLHLIFYLKLLSEPQYKKHWIGFIITGVLSIYSGIFVGMLLIAEILCCILIRKYKQIFAVVVVLVLISPLFLNGYKTFFQSDSGRHRALPMGVNATRIVGFPQELFVARSFGPTPDEMRRLSFSEVIHEKSIEIGVELLVITCIFISYILCFRYRRTISAANTCDTRMIQALGCIVVTVFLQAFLIMAVTGYQMNARHIGFIFGPLFVLGIYPIVRDKTHLHTVLFIIPLLVLWSWSSANQLFNSAYDIDDFKNTAKIIKNDKYNTSEVVALCNPYALRHYSVKNSVIYFQGSPQVTNQTVREHLKNYNKPVWLVLNRPWSYPNFNIEKLDDYFQILQTKKLPGIYLWLLSPKDYRYREN